MIPPEIYTGIAVFLGGVLTYEYSMWRTKRYIKKLGITQLAQTFLKPQIPAIEKTKIRKPDEYE